MEITIRVDETVIAEATRRAFAEAFRKPDRYHTDDKGGEAYAALRLQVGEFARKIDFRPMIEQEARLLLDGAIREVLAEELRASVKRTVRTMKEEGNLFPKETPA